MHVLDQSWMTYIADIQKQNNKDGKEIPKGEVAQQILNKVGLERATSVDVLVDHAYRNLVLHEETPNNTIIRFTHILAALNAKAPKNFTYLTREGKFRTVQDRVALDSTGVLEEILPEDYTKKFLLDSTYFSGFSSCTEKDWIAWVTSEKSGLTTCVGFTAKRERIYNRQNLREFVEAHGGTMPMDFRIQSMTFTIDDHDFAPALWTHWGNLEKSDPQIWMKIVRLIVSDPTKSWKEYLSPNVLQRGTKYDYPVDCGELKATWVIRLQSLPCLEDTKGSSRKPTELLLRSRETEAQFGIEPFVHQDLDNEGTKDLIKALGVRSTPISPDTIVQRIRIFAGHPSPPVFELELLYRSIDSMLSRCTTKELTDLRQDFATECLIYTEEGGWATSNEVFLNRDATENLEVPLVFSQVRQLSMWPRLGVADRPTIGLLLSSLNNLKPGQQIESQSSKRIQDRKSVV